MSEHHPKHVTALLKWCSTCKRNTMHRVDSKREGSCTEHAASGLSKAQEKQKAAKEKEESEPRFNF
jgi:ribosomal protein L44E